MQKLFNPRQLLTGVVFLSVVIANTINKQYVIYFAVPAILLILFLWGRMFKYNSANNVSNLANKTFAIVTLILLVITFMISWYNNNFLN